MGLHLHRKKERKLLLVVIYRFFKLFSWVNSKNRLSFFLNLEWIFDRLAHEVSFEYYNIENHPLRIYTIDYIRKNITINNNVLDLGCNSGELSSKLANFSRNVVGVDYNDLLITLAKKKHKKSNLEFICADAFEYLKTTKQKFDIIILSHILEHVEDPITFLKKCVLHVEKIYIELPDYDRSYFNHYRTDIKSKLNYSDEDHIWEFDRNELFLIIDKSGYKVIDCEFKFGLMKVWCSRK